MKPSRSITLGIFALLLIGVRADTVALWTFENPPFVSMQTNHLLGLSADIGNGAVAGIHNSGSSTFFFPVGNGSAYSFASDHWTSSDLLSFSFSTVGYENIHVSFDLAADLAGPTNFAASWSTTKDAATFLTLRCPVNLSGDWNSVTNDPSATAYFDLSGLSEVNNASSVYFELKPWGPGTTNSVIRIDNFLVTGNAIPEPALPIFVPLLLIVLRRPACSRAGR